MTTIIVKQGEVKTTFEFDNEKGTGPVGEVLALFMAGVHGMTAADAVVNLAWLLVESNGECLAWCHGDAWTEGPAWKTQ